VLIEATTGKERIAKVVTALEKVEGIKSVDPIAGPYDAIAVVEMPHTYAIGGVVTAIQSVSGIARTTTCIAL